MRRERASQISSGLPSSPRLRVRQQLTGDFPKHELSRSHLTSGPTGLEPLKPYTTAPRSACSSGASGSSVPAAAAARLIWSRRASGGNPPDNHIGNPLAAPPARMFPDPLT